MRFHFPNLDRPKKAAKRIARLLGGAPPLSKVQSGLAVALGYRDRERAPLPGAAQFIDPFFHLRGRSQPCALQSRYREADSTSVDGRLSYRPQSAKVPADVE
jgi:hypothetical protein